MAPLGFVAFLGRSVHPKRSIGRDRRLNPLFWSFAKITITIVGIKHSENGVVSLATSSYYFPGKIDSWRGNLVRSPAAERFSVKITVSDVIAPVIDPGKERKLGQNQKRPNGHRRSIEHVRSATSGVLSGSSDLSRGST